MADRTQPNPGSLITLGFFLTFLIFFKILNK
jgi:hypothetical protein